MTFFTYLGLFVFGLAIGSFLNVIGTRYQEKERLLSEKTIGGRSFCVFCRTQLKWHELVPLLSFLIQIGRCNHCGRKISFQYPLVELLSGFIFIFVPFSLYNLFIIHNSYFVIQAVLWIMIFLLLVLLSIIDFRLSIIPDSINLSLTVLGVVLILIHVLYPALHNSFLGHYSFLFDFWPLSMFSGQWSVIFNHLFAAFSGMAFFGAIIILSRGRAMGMGDFKLIGALGLIFGWPDILMTTAFSFIVGAIFSVPFLIKGVKTMKDAVPFGPFIVSAAVLTFFFGYQIIGDYFKLFGAIY